MRRSLAVIMITSAAMLLTARSGTADPINIISPSPNRQGSSSAILSYVLQAKACMSLTDPLTIYLQLRDVDLAKNKVELTVSGLPVNRSMIRFDDKIGLKYSPDQLINSRKIAFKPEVIGEYHGYSSYNKINNDDTGGTTVVIEEGMKESIDGSYLVPGPQAGTETLSLRGIPRDRDLPGGQPYGGKSSISGYVKMTLSSRNITGITLKIGDAATYNPIPPYTEIIWSRPNTTRNTLSIAAPPRLVSSKPGETAVSLMKSGKNDVSCEIPNEPYGTFFDIYACEHVYNAESLAGSVFRGNLLPASSVTINAFSKKYPDLAFPVPAQQPGTINLMNTSSLMILITGREVDKFAKKEQEYANNDYVVRVIGQPLIFGPVYAGGTDRVVLSAKKVSEMCQ